VHAPLFSGAMSKCKLQGRGGDAATQDVPCSQSAPPQPQTPNLSAPLLQELAKYYRSLPRFRRLLAKCVNLIEWYFCKHPFQPLKDGQFIRGSGPRSQCRLRTKGRNPSLGSLSAQLKFWLQQPHSDAISAAGLPFHLPGGMVAKERWLVPRWAQRSQRGTLLVVFLPRCPLRCPRAGFGFGSMEQPQHKRPRPSAA